AVAESKERAIGQQFDALTEMLKTDRLATAVTGQKDMEQDLGKLLELLLTEQRGDRIKDEKERIKEQIRRIKEIINREMEIKHNTQAGADPGRLAEGQAR